MFNMLSMLDIIEIADIFLADGFTLYGSYVTFRAWCEHNNRPLNCQSLLLRMTQIDATGNILYVFNFESKSLKATLKKISEKYGSVKRDLLETEDRERFPVECKHTNTYRIERLLPSGSSYLVYIQIYKSNVELNKFAVLSDCVLCYGPTGYSLCKLVKYTLDEILSHIYNDTLFYVCKLSGDKKKAAFRKYMLHTTKNALKYGWHVPEWNGTHRNMVIQEQHGFQCFLCNATTSPCIYKYQYSMNVEIFLCEECFFNKLLIDAESGRYVNNTKKLLVDIG